MGYCQVLRSLTNRYGYDGDVDSDDLDGQAGSALKDAHVEKQIEALKKGNAKVRSSPKSKVNQEKCFAIQ